MPNELFWDDKNCPSLIISRDPHFSNVPELTLHGINVQLGRIDTEGEGYEAFSR
jgi:hypothetical protein